MLHLLRRHPLPILAHFDQALALTYALPPEILAPLLPPGLELDTYQNWGFLALVTVQTRDLRPAYLPRAFGRDFFLTGYRIFTRFRSNSGQVLRGLRILRSDTDHAGMVSWANRLTRYGYHKAEIECRKQDGLLHFAVRTPGSEADLELTGDVRHLPGKLPIGSPFPDIEAARNFVAPLPYTFDYEPESHSMIVVRGRRPHWHPQPVDVQVRTISFFATPPFNQCTPVLANAFFLTDVPYRWDRGRREKLEAK